MARVAALAFCLAVIGCGEEKQSTAQFGPKQTFGDRANVRVRFESKGVTLVGTLSLPPGEGPHPTLVWVHGSGPETRDQASSFYAQLLDPRYAFFSFDKRGAGESGGVCCPLDFDLLADDVVAAVDAVRQRDEVDRDAVGLMALSQGGWIAPLAANRDDDVEFAVILSGSAVSVGEETEYSQLTGDDACVEPPNPRAEIAKRMREEKPSGFDPRPELAKLEIPVLWLYGALDQSQPVQKDLTVLRPLRDEGKEFAIVVFPSANHALRVSETGTCVEGIGPDFVPDLGSTINQWLEDFVVQDDGDVDD
jgi:pimeloyl-ACP methyl ester carboxylesterase